MRSNDFRVDTTPSASPSILRRRQTLLGLALLLTIPQMISAVYLPIRWALDAKAGAALNIAHLASNELYFLVMSIAGAAVLKMMLSDATFSRTLVRCTRAEGTSCWLRRRPFFRFCPDTPRLAPPSSFSMRSFCCPVSCF